MSINRSVTAIVSRQLVILVGVSVTGVTAIESALGNIIGKNEANAGGRCRRNRIGHGQLIQQ
jgi:hypothetical protein